MEFPIEGKIVTKWLGFLLPKPRIQLTKTLCLPLFFDFVTHRVFIKGVIRTVKTFDM
jgi:hypothetical protein